MSGIKGMRGSGGRRVGSGRKPALASVLAITGGHSRLAAARGVETGVASRSAELPVVMPSDVPPAVAAVWETLGPHAQRLGTLTAETACAFADLCEAIVMKRLMLAQIQADGLTTVDVSVDGAGVEHQTQKAHPLIAKWTTLMVRVEAGLGRFRLTADGKPAVGAAPAKAVNPLDRFITSRA